MKAIVQPQYGSPDVLQLRDVDKPVVKAEEMLVRVRVAAVNIGLASDARQALRRALGGRIAGGEARDTGTRYRGTGRGGRRKGPAVPAGRRGIRLVPRRVRGICVCGGRQSPPPAFQLHVGASGGGWRLRVDGACCRTRSGEGAAGADSIDQRGVRGVGTFAVQIAKAFGANVTGVCSTASLDMVRSLGADQVIDYTKEDFLETGQRYDAMLDLVGSRSLSDCRRALTRRGTYVVVGVKEMGRWLGLGRQFRALLLSPFLRQRMRVFVVRHTRAGLADLKELVEAGKLTPVIDRRYPLTEVPEALRHQGEGHPRGKIVVVL
jgi:hypothetical protein